MPKIEELSEHIINQIAAGEVVTQPASAVKELLENSIDAGSSKIDIFIENGGKNKILVSDNGHGMAKQDLSIAIRRHTTSKLNQQDIMDINSFGFRGEALPSIASVSRMKITSFDQKLKQGYEINVAAGQSSAVVPASISAGCKVEIKDLFYSMPARLKFLKTDRSENNAILEIVRIIAMAHPGIRISLYFDGKIKLQSAFYNDHAAFLGQFISKDFAKNSVRLDVNNASEGFHFSGFISLPTFNRANSKDQYIFVNNRPIKDKMLAIALKIAYQDYIAPGRFPAAVIFITCPPKQVDVNIHPAKNEIRFRQHGWVRDMLVAALRQSLEQNCRRTSTSLADKTMQEFYVNNEKAGRGAISEDINPYQGKPATQGSAAGQNYSNPQPAHASGHNQQNRQHNISFSGVPLSVRGTQVQESILRDSKADTIYNADSLINAEVKQNSAATSTAPAGTSAEHKEDIYLGEAVAQLGKTYIIAKTADHLFLIDQHAAHERLVYEDLKHKLLHDQELPSSRLLMPEIVQLDRSSDLHGLLSQQEFLKKSGLLYEKFNDDSVIVKGLPLMIKTVNIPRLMQDLADQITEMGQGVALAEIIEHITETYACHHSIRAGRVLSIAEMNEMLRQMEKVPGSGQCNHGRPTYIKLPLSDISKLFGRT